MWATLAIRDLLNCDKRYDRIESLEKRLAGTPRNFDKLYEKMFKSIDVKVGLESNVSNRCSSFEWNS